MAKTSKLIWTQTVPTTVGWYWYRNLKHAFDKEPIMLYVRDFAGKLAVINCDLTDWMKYSKGSEWAGPIISPEERKIK